MKAISLWEPWATAMALGHKRNETRSWPAPVCKELVICAAKRKMTALDMEIADLLKDHDAPPIHFAYGCAVCIVDLVECIPSEVYLECFNPSPLELSLGDYSLGRWIWRTENLQRIRPVPIVGHQGFFSIPSTTQFEFV